METNINPRPQKDKSTVGPIEELNEIQVDPNEPSRVVKINKWLKGELEQQFVEFLSLNQDMFAWAHADMVGIHLKVVPPVEHRPAGEASAPEAKNARCRAL